MKASIWTVAVVVVLVGVVFVGVSAQSESATVTEEREERHVLNESEPAVLEQADEWKTLLDHTVTNAETGEELQEVDDYTLNETTGELLGTPPTDGTAVDVWYQYERVDDTTNVIAAIMGPVSPALGWLPVLAAIGAVLGFIALLPSGGGRW